MPPGRGEAGRCSSRPRGWRRTGWPWRCRRGRLRYRVTQGAVTKLAVDLRPELEVQGAEAHRPADLPAAGGIAPMTPPGRLAGPAGVRLRDWRVTGPGPARWLELEFQGPVSGEC